MAKRGEVTIKFHRRSDECWFFALRRKRPLKEGAYMKRNFFRKHYFDIKYGGKAKALEACKQGREEAMETGMFIGRDKEHFDTVKGVILFSTGTAFVTALGTERKKMMFTFCQAKGDKQALLKAISKRREVELEIFNKSDIDLKKIDIYYDAYCKKHSDKLPWLLR